MAPAITSSPFSTHPPTSFLKGSREGGYSRTRQSAGASYTISMSSPFVFHHFLFKTRQVNKERKMLTQQPTPDKQDI